MTDRLLDAVEVAELLHVPVSWVRESTRSGAIPQVMVEFAAAESRIERLAAQLAEHEDDWTEDLPHFASAVHHEIKQALYDATTSDDIDALNRCQSIQDAIDVLTFAIERDDRVR